MRDADKRWRGQTKWGPEVLMRDREGMPASGKVCWGVRCGHSAWTVRWSWRLLCEDSIKGAGWQLGVLCFYRCLASTAYSGACGKLSNYGSVTVEIGFVGDAPGVV